MPVDQTIEAGHFALETLSDGAILLDLESGLIFQLNGTAAFIWGRVLGGVPAAQAGRDLARAFALPEEAAQRDVNAVLALPKTYAPAPPPTPFQYEFVDGRYRFSDGRAALLEVDPEQGLVRALPAFDGASASLVLTSITPKVAALMGLSLMHSSAVTGPRGTATLFVGPSGAGKTTTARALAASGTGWALMSEDKVALRLEGERVAAVVDGERRIHGWMAEARKRLTADSSAVVPTAALAVAATGDTVPIDRVVLIDSARRREGPLVHTRLGQTDAARAIFHFGFYGSHRAEEWRRQLATTAALGRSASTFEATMPSGLGALAEMARTYAETTMS